MAMMGGWSHRQGGQLGLVRQTRLYSVTFDGLRGGPAAADFVSPRFVCLLENRAPGRHNNGSWLAATPRGKLGVLRRRELIRSTARDHLFSSRAYRSRLTGLYLPTCRLFRKTH